MKIKNLVELFEVTWMNKYGSFPTTKAYSLAFMEAFLNRENPSGWHNNSYEN